MPWMDKTPSEAFSEMAKEATWQRNGHRIQRVDFTTGHMVENVALCKDEQTAEFIFACIKQAQR